MPLDTKRACIMQVAESAGHADVGYSYSSQAAPLAESAALQESWRLEGWSLCGLFEDARDDDSDLGCLYFKVETKRSGALPASYMSQTHRPISIP